MDDNKPVPPESRAASPTPSRLPPQPAVGDRVQMRKKHPCGSDQWDVYRIGADIGLRCTGCERRVMLPRREFNKGFKKFILRADEQDQKGS